MAGHSDGSRLLYDFSTSTPSASSASATTLYNSSSSSSSTSKNINVHGDQGPGRSYPSSMSDSIQPPPPPTSTPQSTSRPSLAPTTLTPHPAGLPAHPSSFVEGGKEHQRRSSIASHPSPRSIHPALADFAAFLGPNGMPRPPSSFPRFNDQATMEAYPHHVPHPAYAPSLAAGRALAHGSEHPSDPSLLPTLPTSVPQGAVAPVPHHHHNPFGAPGPSTLFATAGPQDGGFMYPGPGMDPAGMPTSVYPPAPFPPSVQPGLGRSTSAPDFRSAPYFSPFEVKHRRRTSKSQFRVLEDTFLANPKPNAQVRKALAEQLDMTVRAIQVWFQNRRAKAKAQAKKAVQAAAAAEEERQGGDGSSQGGDRRQSLPSSPGTEGNGGEGGESEASKAGTHARRASVFQIPGSSSRSSESSPESGIMTKSPLGFPVPVPGGPSRAIGDDPWRMHCLWGLEGIPPGCGGPIAGPPPPFAIPPDTFGISYFPESAAAASALPAGSGGPPTVSDVAAPPPVSASAGGEDMNTLFGRYRSASTGERPSSGPWSDDSGPSAPGPGVGTGSTSQFDTSRRSSTVSTFSGDGLGQASMDGLEAQQPTYLGTSTDNGSSGDSFSSGGFSQDFDASGRRSSCPGDFIPSFHGLGLDSAGSPEHKKHSVSTSSSTSDQDAEEAIKLLSQSDFIGDLGLTGQVGSHKRRGSSQFAPAAGDLLALSSVQGRGQSDSGMQDVSTSSQQATHHHHQQGGDDGGGVGMIAQQAGRGTNTDPYASPTGFNPYLRRGSTSSLTLSTIQEHQLEIHEVGAPPPSFSGAAEATTPLGPVQAPMFASDQTTGMQLTASSTTIRPAHLTHVPRRGSGSQLIGLRSDPVLGALLPHVGCSTPEGEHVPGFSTKHLEPTPTVASAAAGGIVIRADSNTPTPPFQSVHPRRKTMPSSTTSPFEAGLSPPYPEPSSAPSQGEGVSAALGVAPFLTGFEFPGADRRG